MMTKVGVSRRKAFLGLAAAILFGGRASGQESSSIPSGVSDALRDLRIEDRTPLPGTHPLRIRNMNTDEEVAIPIIHGGQGQLIWNEQAFSRLDWLFRDWRENLSARIDRRIYVFLYL